MTETLVELNEPELRTLIGTLRRQIRKDERTQQAKPWTPEMGEFDVQSYKIERRYELLAKLEAALNSVLQGS